MCICHKDILLKISKMYFLSNRKYNTKIYMNYSIKIIFKRKYIQICLKKTQMIIGKENLNFLQKTLAELSLHHFLWSESCDYNECNIM